MKMRMSLAAAIAMAALGCTAVALGATKTYSGSDSDSQCGVIAHTKCDVSFDGVVKNGKVTKVKNFVVDLIPMTCNEGSFAFTIKGNPLPTMKVDAHRKFSGHFHSGSGNGESFYDVTGKFSKSFKSANGTVQIHGDFPPQATGCDTGVDDYSVKRLVTST